MTLSFRIWRLEIILRSEPIFKSKMVNLYHFRDSSHRKTKWFWSNSWSHKDQKIYVFGLKQNFKVSKWHINMYSRTKLELDKIKQLFEHTCKSLQRPLCMVLETWWSLVSRSLWMVILRLVYKLCFFLFLVCAILHKT